MSVKLIVVALLAAAATTGRAADEDPKADTLVIKTCPKDTVDCACATSADNTKNYTVGKCTADGDKSWMLDGCDAMVVKTYHNKACDLETFELKTACEVISYHKAECSGSTVKLFAGCNTDKCGTGKGVNGDDDNGCPNPTTFQLTEANNRCLKAGNKYYKLASTKCPASDEAQTVSFSQHLVQGCTDTGVSVPVPMTCAATGYQKVSCSDAGVSIDVCKKTGCEECTSTKIPLKEYKKADSGDYLYVDSCPPATANNVTFQVYADVKKYELGCKDLVEATCGTTTTTTTTEAITTTETDPTINTNDSSSNNSSDDSTGSGIIAPAHSVGVLALVLCVLACVY